ncbi:MAG TPA: alpha-glucuronidase family glycosyl hydrolase [Pyrinomonadaceae bacterium]|nr:alpha-glucuronidase family glycosyl hydrolase [Pyrinomonadaceae bacterium]
MAYFKPQKCTQKYLAKAFALFVFFCGITCVKADDGYRLWLRYERLPEQSLSTYRESVKSIAVQGQSATFDAIRRELSVGCAGLLGMPIVVGDRAGASVVIGTPQTSPVIRKLRWTTDLNRLGPEGYRIRTVKNGNRTIIVVASSTDVGALYGAFHFLRLLQTETRINDLFIDQKPDLKLRILDHWDNLDGSIERGYAGKSLWNWAELPGHVDQRLTDYARANASIGINGSALNNVNANAQILTAEYLTKVAAIANVFRPYGIRVYLSARFSAPMEIGNLSTADPLDPTVIGWWKAKADEIYKLIPDFGGFVVKANSEGQPGPRTYNRTHADGANMLAAAVAPHKGIVMWRAFVYDMKPGYDRAGAAYENLQPFDGKFAPNVLLQVKNGPIDFQPREPFHPLFGAMPKTQMMPEFQITQEYLGFSNHLVFLASMWRDFLSADTFTAGRDSRVAQVVDGSLFRQRLTGIAGVANTGSDRNWTDHDMLQANWYAFGRLAWSVYFSPEQIASEWIKMTLTHDSSAVTTIMEMMLRSHDAVVNYMTPLGLHHLFWGGHHYGPAPWWDTEKRDDWNPVYYHKADAFGIGFDRTKTGSNTVSQYQFPLREEFSDVDRCPEEFLLWFHHVSWDHKMKSGRTLWDELALDYQRGVDWVRETRMKWTGLKGKIDDERYTAISKKLAIQERDAVWWRDACLLYFQTFSKKPLPEGVEKPAHTLAEYKAKALEW